jgi:MAPEG family protein
MTSPDMDWKQQRRSGMRMIALALVVGIAVWLALYRLLPPLVGMDELGARMVVALKCVAVATLFCFVAGVEAVAHERLQSDAFDPLAGHQSKRLRVNLRYLQNTLEQLIVFAVGLFGLAAFLSTGEAMRAVVATTVVWILSRFAFWVGYHRSAAMRGLGAPGMAMAMMVLIYVVARIGGDLAGTAGFVIAIGAFLGLEAVLFLNTGQGR